MSIYSNKIECKYAELPAILKSLTENISITITDPQSVLFDSIKIEGSLGYIIKNNTPANILVDLTDSDFSSCTNIVERKGPFGWFGAGSESEACTQLAGIGKLPSCMTSGNNCFRYCINFKTLDGIKNSDFTNITSAIAMFSHCTALTEIPEDFGTTFINLRYAQAIFAQCTGLTSASQNPLRFSKKLQRIDQSFEGTGFFAP